MATFTENYSLIKPDGDDYYDIADFNENMDTLDSAMAVMETGVTELSEKIGTPAEAGQTIFSLLNGGSSPVRSIQRVTYTNETQSTTEHPVPIRTVDPNKCFVLLEFLNRPQDRGVTFDYKLNATTISITHSSCAVSTFQLGFWIIELN